MPKILKTMPKAKQLPKAVPKAKILKTMPKILKTMPKAKPIPKAVPKKLKRKMYT